LVVAEQVQVRRVRLGSVLNASAAVLPLVLAVASVFLPLWYFQFNAPFLGQRWLEVTIYPLEGIKGAVQDVNVINHYVGLSMIGNEYVPEVSYLPHFYAAVIAVTAVYSFSALTRRRRAAQASLVVMAALIVVLFVFVYFWLYRFTHTIHPDAPIKIEPFDPPFLGEHKIANIVVRSYFGPSIGLHIAAVAIGFASMKRMR